MQAFSDIKVWQKAHALTLQLYRDTTSFPTDERFGLTSQVRRAAASIGGNIAEGCVKGSDVEFARFLRIALGSASELQYHLLLARDLGFLDPVRHESLNGGVEEVKRMLTAFIRTLLAEG